MLVIGPVSFNGVIGVVPIVVDRMVADVGGVRCWWCAAGAVAYEKV
jgi:hypothetical protein